MPYTKAKAGHGSTTRIGKYLMFDKEGRRRAIDFLSLNVMETDIITGQPWWQVMNATRARNHNDQGRMHGGKERAARTYNHYIISLDPKDEVNPELFGDFVRDWAEKWFDGELGRYEVAIVVHNDSSEAVARGEKGNLHAHVVVNNTNLETGRRLSTKLTPRVVQRMRVDIEQRAWAMGWHSFSQTGQSMTPEEMARAGTAPTLTRSEAFKRMLAQEGYTNEPHVTKGVASEEQREGSGKADPEMRSGAGGGTKGKGGREYAYHWINMGDGKYMVAPVDFMTNTQRSRETIEERKHRDREGWSWKQDVRDRVNAAITVSRSIKDLEACLFVLGVNVSYAKDGEIKFFDAEGRGYEVRGSTLGAGYSLAGIDEELRVRATMRMQGRSRGGGLAPEAREAAVRAVARARAGTRGGAEMVTTVQGILDFIEAHGIASYDDFGDSPGELAMRMFAEEHHLFDAVATAPEGELDEIARRQEERAARGEGGLEAGADPEPRAAARGHGDDAEPGAERGRKI